MSASKLVRPVTDVKESYLEAMEEFQKEGKYLKKDLEQIKDNFEQYVEMLHQDKGHPDQEFEDWVDEVPQTILWLIKDKEYIGAANIRLRLNWHLERWGGNISYIVRPSKRGLGFGKKTLQKALPIANALGLDKVLLTIRPDNERGIRVVQVCGGEFQDTTQETDRFPVVNRYWIDCR